MYKNTFLRNTHDFSETHNNSNKIKKNIFDFGQEIFNNLHHPTQHKVYARSYEAEVRSNNKYSKYTKNNQQPNDLNKFVFN